MKRFSGFERGINLGGWLSQGSYDKEHLDSFITDDDFKKIADWGLDHVRIPVDYNIFEDEDGNEKESGYEYIYWALEGCEKYGLNMVLDLHKTAGFSFHAAYGEAGFFDSEPLQERFYRLWERLASRFGGYPERIAFELLNEVTDKEYSDRWNRISRTAIERIRRLAPKTKILIGGYWNNSVDALADLEPAYDENIVYNFHCYDPFLFTHQAAAWLDNMPSDLHISYPGDINDYRRIIKETGFDYIQDYLDVSEQGFSKDYFMMRFKAAAELCEQRGAALYCGEYGVIDKADLQSTLNWHRDISAAFNELGIARAAWSYKGVDFGLIEKKTVLDEIISLL